MKIQPDLDKLSEWCERNALTITFSKTRHAVEFAYMLAETVLDRVRSITEDPGSNSK
jgi:hypothetical protein